MKPHTIEGVIAVIRHHHRYLVIRRSSSVPLPGAWCFPGGAIKAGESQAQALAREVFEEVRLRVKPIEKIWEWTQPGGRLRLHFWLAGLPEGDGQAMPTLQANLAEVAEARWLSSDEIRALPGTIRNLLEFLDHWEQHAG